MPKSRCPSGLQHGAVFFAESPLPLPPRPRTLPPFRSGAPDSRSRPRGSQAFLTVRAPRTSPLLPRSFPRERVSHFVGQSNERPGRPRWVSASGDRDFSKRCFSSLSGQKPARTAARSSSGTTRSAPTTASMPPGETRLFLWAEGLRCTAKALGPLAWSPRTLRAVSLAVATVTPCTWATLLKPPSSREPARGAVSVLPGVWGWAGASLRAAPERGKTGSGVGAGSSVDVRDDSIWPCESSGCRGSGVPCHLHFPSSFCLRVEVCVRKGSWPVKGVAPSRWGR